MLFAVAEIASHQLVHALVNAVAEGKELAIHGLEPGSDQLADA